MCLALLTLLVQAQNAVVNVEPGCQVVVAFGGSLKIGDGASDLLSASDATQSPGPTVSSSPPSQPPNTPPSPLPSPPPSPPPSPLPSPPPLPSYNTCNSLVSGKGCNYGDTVPGSGQASGVSSASACQSLCNSWNDGTANCCQWINGEACWLQSNGQIGNRIAAHWAATC